MTYRLIAAAEEDLRQAAVWYEKQSNGLGHLFLNEFVAVMSRIQQFPEGWKAVSPLHRRCLFRRFPYAVLYTRDHDDVIIVSGVMNLRMNPIHQKQRLGL